MIVLIPNT